MQLTILICTHNRADLLERTLDTLNAARRPEADAVEVLVLANACSDDTVARLAAYAQRPGVLPLRWAEEPRPGKSQALNTAIGLLTGDLVGFVDDDHRVDEEYLTQICTAARTYPDDTLFCGRILPDWDGSEPDWVHDSGPYRIYPVPVPRYERGDESYEMDESGPLPGGGNLFLRRTVFDRVGGFSTELGPVGHDLGGGEDGAFVLKCLRGGERLRYYPGVVQYHYVDPERLRLSYVLRKSFQRSRSSVLVHDEAGRIPLYIWRKLASYGLKSVFSLSRNQTRFFLVRTAATLGELSGMRTLWRKRRDRRSAASRHSLYGELLIPFGLILLALSPLGRQGVDPPWREVVAANAGLALVLTSLIFVKSLLDFSRTGPVVRDEILRHYRWYSMVALLRLGLWVFLLFVLQGGLGLLVYFSLVTLAWVPFSFVLGFASAAIAILLTNLLLFLHQLLHRPANLIASFHYRVSRLYPIWEQLSPLRLRLAEVGLALGAAAIVAAGAVTAAGAGDTALATGLASSLVGYIVAVLWAIWEPEPRPVAATPGAQRVPGARPNILMLGSDTLRADRLGKAGYYRALTPTLDALAERGTWFSQCFVPCARTAPSLASMLTGTWPHTSRIRDNFIADDETRLDIPALPGLLREQGYQTAVVSDWCGADMGKFDFGFDRLSLPEDQWNLRYLLRQGPKDVRLFLSLFTHNRFGRVCLPELYYLGGLPLTRQVGRKTRQELARLARSEKPFFLNMFSAATHPPFGSDYPYYLRFSDPGYSGESKFAMARLTDPFEIIRRQGDGRKEFDLEQILSLYDGCVRSFDDQIALTLDFVKRCGLEDNTIIVVYSDHGMEFFEHETWGQGNSAVGDVSPRVPLVIVDPRKPGGHRVDQVVRSIDLAQTLLDLLDLPAPPTMEGVSLAAALDGEVLPDLDAYNETGIWLTDLPGMPTGHLRYPNFLELMEIPDKDSGTLAIKPEFHQIIIRAKDRMIRSGSWKLVYQPLEDGIRWQLFDVAADPGCQVDVLTEHPAVAERLQAKLLAWVGLSSTGDEDSNSH